MTNLRGRFRNPFESGGYMSHLNPQIEIRVTESRHVNMTFNTSLGNDQTGIILFLTKPKRESGRCTLKKEEIIGKSPYTRGEKVGLNQVLLKGRYVVVLCLEEAGLIGGFDFAIEDFDDSNCRVLPDYERRSVISSWKKFNGGYKSTDNPQFEIAVLEKTHVVIRVEDKNPKNAIIVFVSKVPKRGKRKKSLEDAEVVGKSQFVRATEVMLEIDLEPTVQPYCIIPCSEKDENPFTIYIESNTHEALGRLKELEEEKMKKKKTECVCKDILDAHRDFENPPYFVTNPIDDIIEHCEKHGCLFRDEEFQPTEHSINRDDGRGLEKVGNAIESWKRPEEFLDSPDLYTDGIEIQDMVQGDLGNCWMCQGIATACLEEDRISGLISPNCYCPYGVYSIKMYHEDAWKYMIVDDYFPISKDGKFVFARSQDPNELWVPLMEKAFAKAFGSYRALSTRSIGVALQILSGGENSVRQHETTKMEDLWDRMKEFDKMKWLIGASSKDFDAQGIKGRHAYSVMSVHDVYTKKGKVNLLKIRNTWGEFEWDGEWGDSDRKNWTKRLKKELSFQDLDDGIFHMCLEDYCKFFVSTSFCRILKDVYPIQHKYRGHWEAPNPWSDPDPVMATARKIPIKILTPNTKIHAALVRTSNDILIEDNSILLYMCRGNIGTSGRVPKNQIVFMSKYMVSIQAVIEERIRVPGIYYFLPTATNRKEEYTVLVHADKEIEFGGDFDDPLPCKSSMKGDWSPCEGILMVENPQFSVGLKEKGITEMKINLRRSDNKEKLGMILIVCKPGSDLLQTSRHPQVQKTEVIMQSKYMATKDISLSLSLSYGKEPYIILCCLEKKSQGITYELNISSSKKIVLKNNRKKKSKSKKRVIMFD